MLSITLRFLLLALMLPVLPVFAEDGNVDEHANSIYKCKDDKGRVTYTETPCSENAEAMKDLPALNEQPAVEGTVHVTREPLPEKHESHQQFRCDGRTRCNEMTSCEEAKFFLANCPGVEMDGRRQGQGGMGDGVPCEHHWCDENGEELRR